MATEKGLSRLYPFSLANPSTVTQSQSQSVRLHRAELSPTGPLPGTVAIPIWHEKNTLDLDHADNNGLLISTRSGLVILENAGSRKGMTVIHRGIRHTDAD